MSRNFEGSFGSISALMATAHVRPWSKNWSKNQNVD